MKLLLDWSSYKDAGTGDAYADIPKTGGDFARAVSVCINSRQCETLGKGVMCPSYRVTQEASLSTGGRVRLLKSALNQEGSLPFFEDSVLARAMTLCVGCKGCKRECENEVDMAMIKVEYLAQQHRRKAPSVRTRLLSDVSRQLHRRKWVGTLVRLRNRMSPLARLGEYLLGLSARRRLPEPVKQPFDQSQAVKQAVSGNEVVGEVVLLIDTFTNNFAPENAEAAIAVLQRAGYRVITAQPDATTPEPTRPLCCGRTHIAQGMLDGARHEARRTLSLLPALREYPAARVLANGFSCRHQIREGSNRPSMHLACLVYEAMDRQRHAAGSA